LDDRDSTTLEQSHESFRIWNVPGLAVRCREELAALFDIPEPQQKQRFLFPPVILNAHWGVSLPCGQRRAFSGVAHMANITQSGWKRSKSRSWRALFLLLGPALLTAVGSTGCKKASSEPGRNLHAPLVKGVLHLEAFVVNLADPEENRFLRVGIDLGLENPFPTKESKEGDVPIPRIRDAILAVLSTWHSDALLAPEGKQKLKDEVVHALRERVPELGVKEVYFTDFLVQR
jgi:flagellar basal body-associated protein FliL